jgi:thymidine phosphorylase
MAATIDLSLELTARMLTLGGLSGSVDDAKSMAAKKLSNGDAIEKFRKNAECQGGDVSVFDDPDKLLNNDIEQFEVECETEGFVSSTDALAIGEAVVEIGGGRTRAGDNIDNAVGFRCNLKTGDAVQKGQSLGTAFCRDRAQFELVSEKLKMHIQYPLNLYRCLS